MMEVAIPLGGNCMPGRGVRGLVGIQGIICMFIYHKNTVRFKHDARERQPCHLDDLPSVRPKSQDDCIRKRRPAFLFHLLFVEFLRGASLSQPLVVLVDLAMSVLVVLRVPVFNVDLAVLDDLKRWVPLFPVDIVPSIDGLFKEQRPCDLFCLCPLV